MPGSRVIVANITKHRIEIYTFWDIVIRLSRELVEIDQICQLQECAPRWEEQSINRLFRSSMPGPRVIVANIKKYRFEIYTFWDLVTRLSRELVEVYQICQLQECAPRWEEQSINRLFHSSMPGSRVIVANITKHRIEIYTFWDILIRLSRELVEIDQICQLQECAPRWEEQSINRLFRSSMPGPRVIVANIKKYRFEIYTFWDLVTRLSRELVEVYQICQLQECAPRWEEQSINRLFRSSMPGSRVIVANIKKYRFEIYTFWDLVTRLSRELVEVYQICQWLECSSRWEEQSIIRVFVSSLPGLRVIVANIKKYRFEIYTFWDLVTRLSRELVEVYQICQLQECAPRWEEQSINRLFRSSMPGSRVIVANITKHRFEIYTFWDLVTRLSRELVEVYQICQLQECAPRWEEQSINRLFRSSMPGSRVIVANIKKYRFEIYTFWDLVTRLSRELVEVYQICQWLECSSRWEEQSIIRVFVSSLPGLRVIVANIKKYRFEIYTFWDLVTRLSRELVEVYQICQLQECAPRWEEQSINRLFRSSMPGSRVIVANITKHLFEIYTLLDIVTPLSRELVEIDQICQLQECAPRWEEQSINRLFRSSMPGSRVIVANIKKYRFEIYTFWYLVTRLSRELVEVYQICQ